MLDPIFIFVLDMGVTGAAVATIIGQFCGCILALIFNLKKNKEIHLQFRGFRPNWRLVGNIYAIGLPSVIMVAIGSVMTFCMNKILIAYHSAKETAATAFGIYFKLNSFIFMPVFGLNNGVVPIVAYNYGAQNRLRMVETIKRSTIYASCIILSANAGGAFSPIGDVTTIMLWIKGNITTGGVITELLIPSIVSVVVPTFLLQFKLKGQLETSHTAEAGDALHFSRLERNMVFFIGVGGLIFVPIFRFLTGLPPFMGILLVLGLLWSITEFFYRSKGHVDESMQMRVTQLLKRIDMSTILFFLGILMAVATLQETGVLRTFGQALNEASGGNHYIVTGVIGVVSSIVDNVPLVAGCMGMYDILPGTDFAVDGIFWQLLAYCAGVGGSMLIIGSAAGVVVMGLEKITFGWYMRHITWIAFVGYLAGIGAYAVEKMIGM